MSFLSRIYFDVAPEGGEGAGGGTGTQVAPESFITAEEAKNYGFDSKEALLSFMQQKNKPEETPEDKTRRENIEKANLLKYSTENNLLTVDEYNQAETLRAKADKDLVYERFYNEFKEDNSDLTPEQLEAQVEEAFQKEYHLSDANSKSKARGEARLAREASSIRQPLESKVSSAKERFTEDNQVAAKLPDFNKFLDNLVKELVPDKLLLATPKVTIGEGDKKKEESIPIEVEVTAEERKEIAKAFRNNKTLYNFLKSEGKSDVIRPSLEKKIKSYLWDKYKDVVISQVAEKTIGIGMANGSNIGAMNSFEMNKKNDTGGKAATEETLEKSNAKIAIARENARNSR